MSQTGINCLSLFDGISCGQIALERAGIKVQNYYASEIDKYAIQGVTQPNYPDTIQLGDINEWRNWDIDFSTVDLITAGFPCQSFSVAGKQLGDKDPRGMLFWVMLDVIKHVKELNPNVKFLMENVKMKSEFEQYITYHTEQALGEVNKHLIDSALVSAQRRLRYYWTNIQGITQPEDKGITWGDVREHNVEWSSMYYSDAAMEWIGKHGTRKGKKLKIHEEFEKMQMIEASHCKKYSSQRFFGIIDEPNINENLASIKGRYLKDEIILNDYEQPSQITGRRLNAKGHREDYNKDIKATQCLEVREGDKTNCLTTVQKDNVIARLPIGRYPDVFKKLELGKHYRYITPLECEKLQTLPPHFTARVSNSQRYKLIGNSFTPDVFVHLLSFLPERFFQ